MKGKNNDERKGKKILQWIAVGVVVLLALVKFWEYCEDYFHAEGVWDTFKIYEQGRLAVSDGRLYYCDLRRENALYSYDLETKEIRLIEEAEGVLKKTGTGVYYIVENVVYRIEKEALTEVYRIPAEKFTFIDCYQGTVYWIAREKRPEDKDWYRLAYLYAQTCFGESEPRLLFHKEEEDINDAVIARDSLYLMTEEGIYCTEPGKDKWNKISEENGSEFFGDATCVLLKAHPDETGEAFYEVTPEGQLERRTSDSGSTVALHEGVLYYPHTNGLYKKSLGAEEAQEAFLTEVPEEVWYMMEAYEGGVFMRGYLSCDIWQYDAATGTISCVIKQRKE